MKAIQQWFRPRPIQEWCWPSLADEASARAAIRIAFWAAVYVAVATAAAPTLLLQSSDNARMSVGAVTGAYMGAALFAILAFFIRRGGTTASTLGLLLFAAETAFALSQGAARSSGILMRVLVLVLFLNGARGSWALKRFQRAEQTATPPPTLPA